MMGQFRLTFSNFTKFFSKFKAISFVKKKAVRHLLHNLDHTSQSLELLFKNAEPEFLTLGRILESIDNGAGNLGNLTFDAVKNFQGDTGDGSLTYMGGLAEKSLKSLQQIHSRADVNLKQIDSIAKLLGELHNACSEIEKIALFLRVVGFNIGVESARSEKAGEMFTVVSQQIYQLSEKVSRISHGMRQDSESAQRSQMLLHKKISNRLLKLQKFGEEAEKEVQNALQNTGQLTDSSINALERASAHTQAISGHIGKVVMGIQSHDSMSQAAAGMIGEIKTLAESFPERGLKLPAKNRQTAHQTIGFQLETLNNMINKVESVYRVCQMAFEEIYPEVEQLTGCLANFGLSGEFTLGKDSRGSKDSLESLQSALSHLLDLIKKGDAMAGHIQETAREATLAAEKLSDHMEHVREISFETHIAALNAIVKAAHLKGEGRSLEVLAHEVKKLSDQTNAFAAGVERIIDSISASVSSLLSPDMGEASLSPKEENLPVLLDKGLDDVTEAYANLKNESSNALESAGSLNDDISRAISHIAFFRDMLQELRKLKSILEDSMESNAISTVGTKDRTPPTRTGLTALAATQKPMKQLMDGDDNQEMGDNVELF